VLLTVPNDLVYSFFNSSTTIGLRPAEGVRFSRFLSALVVDDLAAIPNSERFCAIPEIGRFLEKSQALLGKASEP
jgi:hypothetical protein